MENRVSRGHGQYSASADKRATEHQHNISEFGFFPPAEAASGVERTPPPGDGSDTVTRRCVSLVVEWRGAPVGNRARHPEIATHYIGAIPNSLLGFGPPWP
jgi:hypothetical protein